ncbi:MAG: ATP-binding protein, partial [Pseudomonadota bacterium]|nr:ATP-binding protein [Pseudomonadota bacterium]
MSNSIANAVVLDQAKPSGKRQQLKPAQRACYDVLRLAVREGHVFAALTGPSGSGKTTILEALLAELRGPSLRCIRVREPQKVSAQLASQIEQAAYSEARKPDNVGRHLLLVVDDAHAGSAELLSCVTRIAEMREPGRRVPQILLVGGATLWERLAADEYQPLARSLAIRTALPAAEEDDGLWASVEQGMAPTARSLHPDAIRLLQAAAPDPPAAPPTQMRGRGLRLFVPLGLFLLSAGASVYSLSLHRWPDFLNGLSWERINPSAPPG